MRTIIVLGDKEFKLTVPDSAKLTFGPWTPPNKESRGYGHEAQRGTLRVYDGSKENIIGVFSGVTSFRDVSLNYSEKIAQEEGESVWKSDQNGYERKEKVSTKSVWVNSNTKALPPASKKGKSIRAKKATVRIPGSIN